MDDQPPLRRLQLAAELRRLREDTAMTGGEQQPGWSTHRRRFRIETGRVPVSARDVRGVLDLYQVQDADHRMRLGQLARDAQDTG